jgi:carboxypeptidase T
MKNFLLALLCLVLSIAITAQEKMVVRFEQPDTLTFKTFTQPHIDVAAVSPGNYLDIVVSQSEYDDLLSQGYNVSIVFTMAEMAANLQGNREIPGYHTFSEALTELQQIAAANPDICKLYDIGDSRGKEYFNAGYGNYSNYQHDIWALKVSDNVEADEDEPAIYYLGAHHAREPLSTEVVFYVLNHIIDNYGSDPEITENVNTKEIWFVPIVNPDGHTIVLNQINTDWRKNIRDNDGNGSFTNGNWSHPDGVDPNRNYGWEWGGDGSSGDPSSLTYRGPEPFSEPETQAIRDLMADRHFVAGISYHTYSELVLWPYGYTVGATAPDVTAISALGTAMGQAIPKLGSGHYDPIPAYELYAASGVTDDYAYGQHGIFSYTIELATQFIPPQNQVIQVCEDNLNAAMILLNRVNTSTLTGLVTNSVTGEPVVAEIYVDGIDNTGLFREPYMSNETFGRYFRLLPTGNYSVTFSAFGYISQSFDNVNINNQDQTILDVQLQQSQIISVSGTITDAATGEPIQGATIEIMNTPIDPAFSNENGEYNFEELFENTYNFKVFALDYATLIQEVTVDPQNNIVDFQLIESFAESFETGAFGPGWTFGGNANWTITNQEAWDGNHSAKSGNIGNQASSEVSFTMEVAIAGQISFYRKVSSESGYDYLKFYINNQVQDQWSGEEDWQEFSYNVGTGTQTFKWVYEKDFSVANGSDCGWIDYVIFPPVPAVNAQAGPDATICQDENHQCDGNAAFYETIQWTTSGNGEFSDPTILNPVYVPGTEDISGGSVILTLTATDGSDNQATDNLTLTIDPLPAAANEISGLEEVCAGSTELYSTDDIDFADDYEWILTPETAGVIENSAGNEILITWNETFFDQATLTVRGMNDCGYGDFSDEKIIQVEDCTAIGEIELSGFSIQPNPATDQVQIVFGYPINSEVGIKIYSILGELIYDGKHLFGEDAFFIDLNNFNEGIYFISISNNNINLTRKLIIRN